MKRFIAPVLLTFMAAIAMIVTRSAQADIVVFTAVLLPANEVPPVTVNATETGTTGSATVTLDVTRSGSTITAATARFDVSLTGMASNTVIILAHIHEGSASVNGPVRVDSGISPASPVATSGGAAFFSRSNLTVSPSVAQGIINNPGGWYFNVHSALSPSGICRGQLTQQTTPSLNTPTLSEWGMILMTLLFTALGAYFLTGRAALAGADESIALPVRAINWKLFAKVSLVVEAITAAVLVALRAGAIDTLGALASGLVAAFIIHLFIGNARRH
ncbi:MAG: CHRD domain-containing protein [Acidobacteriota bacterium]